MTEVDNLINYLHNQLMNYRITWYDTLKRVDAIYNEGKINYDKIKELYGNDNYELMYVMTENTGYNVIKDKDGIITHVNINDGKKWLDVHSIIKKYINNPTLFSEIVPSANELRILSSIIFNKNVITADNIVELYTNAFVMPDHIKKEIPIGKEGYIIDIVSNSKPSFLFDKITSQFCDEYIKIYEETDDINDVSYNTLYKICKLIKYYKDKNNNYFYRELPYYPNINSNVITTLINITKDSPPNEHPLNNIEKKLFNYFTTNADKYLSVIQNIFDGRLIETLKIDVPEVEDLNDDNYLINKKDVYIVKTKNVVLRVSVIKKDHNFYIYFTPAFDNIFLSSDILVGTVDTNGVYSKMDIENAINICYSIFKQALLNISYCYSTNFNLYFAQATIFEISLCKQVQLYTEQFLNFENNTEIYGILYNFKRSLDNIVKKIGDNINDKLKYYTYGKYNLRRFNVNIDEIVKACGSNINNIVKYIPHGKSDNIENSEEYFVSFFDHLVTYFNNKCGREFYRKDVKEYNTYDRVNNTTTSNTNTVVFDLVVRNLYDNILIKMFVLDKINYLDFFYANSECDICVFLNNIDNNNDFIKNQIISEIKNNIGFYIEFNNFDFSKGQTDDSKKYSIYDNLISKVNRYKLLLKNTPCSKVDSITLSKSTIDSTYNVYREINDIESISKSYKEIKELLVNLKNMPEEIKYINDPNMNKNIIKLIGLFCYSTTDYKNDASEYTNILNIINRKQGNNNDGDIVELKDIIKLLDFSYELKKKTSVESLDIYDSSSYDSLSLMSDNFNDIMADLYYFFDKRGFEEKSTDSPIGRVYIPNTKQTADIVYFEKFNISRLIDKIVISKNTSVNDVYTCLPPVFFEKYGNYFLGNESKIRYNKKDYYCLLASNCAKILIKILDKIFSTLVTNVSMVSNATINSVFDIINTMVNMRVDTNKTKSQQLKEYFYRRINDVNVRISRDIQDTYINIIYNINYIIYLQNQRQLLHYDNINPFTEIPVNTVFNDNNFYSAINNLMNIIEHKTDRNNLSSIVNDIRPFISMKTYYKLMNDIQNYDSDLDGEYINFAKNIFNIITNDICLSIKYSYLSFEKYRSSIKNTLCKLYINNSKLILDRFEIAASDFKKCITKRRLNPLIRTQYYEDNITIIKNFLRPFTIFNIGPKFNILYDNGKNKPKENNDFVLRYNSMNKQLTNEDNSALLSNVIFTKSGFFDIFKRNEAQKLADDFHKSSYIRINNSKCFGDTNEYYKLPVDINNFYDVMPKISNKKKDKLIQYMYDNIKIIDYAVRYGKKTYSFNEIKRKINNIRIIIDKYILLNQGIKMYNNGTICHYQTNKLVINKMEYKISDYFNNTDFIMLISYFLITLDHDQWLSNYYNKYGDSYISYFDDDKIEDYFKVEEEKAKEVKQEVKTEVKQEVKPERIDDEEEPGRIDDEEEQVEKDIIDDLEITDDDIDRFIKKIEEEKAEKAKKEKEDKVEKDIIDVLEFTDDEFDEIYKLIENTKLIEEKDEKPESIDDEEEQSASSIPEDSKNTTSNSQKNDSDLFITYLKSSKTKNQGAINYDDLLSIIEKLYYAIENNINKIKTTFYLDVVKDECNNIIKYVSDNLSGDIYNNGNTFESYYLPIRENNKIIKNIYTVFNDYIVDYNNKNKPSAMQGRNRAISLISTMLIVYHVVINNKN